MALTRAGERGCRHNTEDPMVCVIMGRHAKFTSVGRFGAERSGPWVGQNGCWYKNVLGSAYSWFEVAGSFTPPEATVDLELRSSDDGPGSGGFTAVRWTPCQVYCTIGPRQTNPILAGGNPIKIGLIGFWKIPW